MTSSENTEKHYAQFTPSILKTKEIIERHGGKSRTRL